jgi:hypothetical protein
LPRELGACLQAMARRQTPVKPRSNAAAPLTVLERPDVVVRQLHAVVDNLADLVDVALRGGGCGWGLESGWVGGMGRRAAGKQAAGGRQQGEGGGARRAPRALRLPRGKRAPSAPLGGRPPGAPHLEVLEAQGVVEAVVAGALGLTLLADAVLAGRGGGTGSGQRRGGEAGSGLDGGAGRDTQATAAPPLPPKGGPPSPPPAPGQKNPQDPDLGPAVALVHVVEHVADGPGHCGRGEGGGGAGRGG